MPYDHSIKTERTRGEVSTPEKKGSITYYIEIPQIEGIKSFNDFYCDIQKKCLAFCNERLHTHCVNEHVYSYRLSCKTHTQNRRITVTLKATLSDKTSAALISSHTEIHKWDLEKFKLRVEKQ